MGKYLKKKVDKFMMHLDVNDGGISRVLATTGEREKVFMSILKSTVKEGDVCFDLGANIGYPTMFMADNVGDSGIVYAVEPDKHNCELLDLNINENNFVNRCEVTQCAITKDDGEIDFWLASAPNLNSVQKTKNSTKKITVPAYNLGTYLENRRYPNFIKMDVEGAEVGIFEGALEYFTENRGRTNILLEVHPQFYDSGNDFEEILKKFFAIGFNPKYLVSTPVGQPQKFKDAGYKPKYQVNTDGFVRGVYTDVKEEDFLNFSCNTHNQPYPGGVSKKIVRCFMIGRDH